MILEGFFVGTAALGRGHAGCVATSIHGHVLDASPLVPLMAMPFAQDR